LNLKFRHYKGKVHLRACDYPDEDWGIGSHRNKGQPSWRIWALCGASGTRRLKETNDPANCQMCLSIANKIKTGTHRYNR
jgi:hypothetical protein